MKLKRMFLTVSLLFNQIIFCGFSPNTLVRVHDGFMQIEQLEAEDIVVSSDLQGNCPEKKITHKKLCRKKDCLCLVVDQEELVTSQNQKFFLANGCTWKSAKDLKVGDVLLNRNGNGITVEEIEELDQTDLFEIEVEGFHTFFISESELLVHNFAAAATVSIGPIVISNPVTALIGVTIALVALTPTLYNTYIKERSKFVCDQASVPSLGQKDSDLIERYYFVQRKKDLEKLLESYIRIVNDIKLLSSKSHTFFSSNFFEHVLAKKNATVCAATNSIISISTERQLSEKQKQQLRTMRQSELLELEREIIELQWSLAVHFHELVERREKTFQAYDEASSQINDAIDLWNNTSEPTYNLVLESYEKDLFERYLLENIHSRNDELLNVLRYYKTSLTVQNCLEKSSNFAEQVKELMEKAIENECWIKKQQDRVTKNLIIVERYCNQNSINLIYLLRKVQDKLKKQKQKLIQKELEEAKQKPAAAPEPDEPENEDGETEFEIPDNSASHMFKDEPGHFPHDTPMNRKRLDLVSDINNFRGTDSHGNKCYEKVLFNGKQLWAYVRGKLIRDGGLNDIPKKFNSKTGFSRFLSSNFKPKC